MRENALDLVQKGLIPMEESRFILPEERFRPERRANASGALPSLAVRSS